MSDDKKRSGYHGNQNAKKTGVEKLMRIRFVDDIYQSAQNKLEFVEEWLSDPSKRGEALYRMAQRRLSDSTTEEYPEGDNDNA